MTLTEWLLTALVVLMALTVVLLYFVLESIMQIRDIVRAHYQLFSGQQAYSTEATQREMSNRIDYIATMISNWRNGR